MRSSGLLVADGIPTGCPTPTLVTGFDVIVKTANALATVQIYDGSATGTLLATHSVVSANVGYAQSVDITPVKAPSGANVVLTTCNAVLRWA